MATKPEKVKKETATSTYLLTMKDGSEQKITIPSSWRLTFGLQHPGARDGNFTKTTALRIYAGNHQKAVFSEVASFRDTSITIMEKVVETKSQMATVKTPEGDKQMMVKASTAHWRNPDEIYPPGKEFTKLPKVINDDELQDVD